MFNRCETAAERFDRREDAILRSIMSPNGCEVNPDAIRGWINAPLYAPTTATPGGEVLYAPRKTQML